MVTIKILIIIEISRLYKPIFKYDKINKRMVLIIMPTRLSYIANLALPVASRKADNGDSREYKINIGLKNLK